MAIQKSRMIISEWEHAKKFVSANKKLFNISYLETMSGVKPRNLAKSFINQVSYWQEMKDWKSVHDYLVFFMPTYLKTLKTQEYD